MRAAHFGRVYAVCGGFFIVLTLPRGWYFEGTRPNWPDILGGAFALLGVRLMME